MVSVIREMYPEWTDIPVTYLREGSYKQRTTDEKFPLALITPQPSL